MLYVLALLTGVVAGLRAMTAPLAIAVAVRLGWLDLSGTVLAILGYKWTPAILLVAAIGELITDQLPSTPSRKVPIQFGTRILVGAVSGGAIGVVAGSLWIGAVIGAIGAIVGTLGGSAARAKMAAAFGQDRPAALIEDAVAILGAILIVVACAESRLDRIHVVSAIVVSRYGSVTLEPGAPKMRKTHAPDSPVRGRTG